MFDSKTTLTGTAGRRRRPADRLRHAGRVRAGAGRSDPLRAASPASGRAARDPPGCARRGRDVAVATATETGRKRAPRRRRHGRAVVGWPGSLAVPSSVLVARRRLRQLALLRRGAACPTTRNWPEDVDVEGVVRRPDRARAHRGHASGPASTASTGRAATRSSGQILASDDDTVTRRLSRRPRLPRPGARRRARHNVYAGNPRQARGLPYRSVEIPSELGPMPAWLIPAEAQLDGATRDLGDRRPRTQRRSRRSACASRPPCAGRAHLAADLLPRRSRRAESPDGLHHLGETEWRDLAGRGALRPRSRRPVAGPRSATRWAAR